MNPDERVRGSVAYLEQPGLLGLSGLEQLRAFAEGRAPAPPLFHLSGLHLSDVGLGMVTATMPASPWWQSGVGIFLPGTLAFVADMAIGGAIYSSLPPATALATSELTLSFLRPASVESKRINARARVIQAGRSQGLAEAHIEDGFGRLLAFATTRCILSPLPFDPPAPPESLPMLDIPAHDTPDPHARPVEGEIQEPDRWEQVAGLDLMRRWLEPDPPLPPVAGLTGWRATEIEEGRVVWQMPASPWFTNPAGVLYGGAISMLADVAMNGALTTTLPAGTAYGTLNLQVHFFKPVQPTGDALTAHATVVRRGRTLGVTTVDVLNPAGETVATGTSSAMILAERPWGAGKPVAPIDEAPPRDASSGGPPPER